MKRLFVLCCTVCVLCMGCATTGSIPAEIVTQSAAIDTSISDLQDQQTTTVQAAEQITATADAIEQTAVVIKDDKLTGQVTTLKAQVKTLNDSLKSERDKVLKLQTQYTELKTSAGTSLYNQSTEIAKLTAQKKTAEAWVVRLAISLAITVVIIAAYILLKLKKIISL